LLFIVSGLNFSRSKRIRGTTRLQINLGAVYFKLWKDCYLVWS